MQNIHPLAELAPRDVVARGIQAEMISQGGQPVLLDATGLGSDFLTARFPSISKTTRDYGLDWGKNPIPVTPAAHYWMGGVASDTWGRTSVKGLFAVGEAGCNGAHGANRLASNSLLECLVVGHRAVDFLVHKLPLGREQQDFDLPPWQSGHAQDLDELVVIYHNWDEIRRLMWDYVGIVRTTKRLQRAATRLRNLEREIQEFYWNFKVNTDLLELRNLCTVASLIVDSALLRQESRGLHYNLDHLETKESLCRPTILRRF
jgi:L-aspartate oxidase